jgi:hypothetical protein
MTRASDALHRRDRYHSHFHRTAGGVSFEHPQKVTGGSPQRRLRRVLSPVEGGGYFRDAGRSIRVGLPRWHTADRTRGAWGMRLLWQSAEERGERRFPGS